MRLIEADYLVEYWEPDGGRMFDANYFIWTVEHAPTIDAVPVIRCKDCIHFSETKKRGAISHSCGYAYGCICPEPDGYCNFAETKRHDD
jgi:hypothetical protein